MFLKFIISHILVSGLIPRKCVIRHSVSEANGVKHQEIHSGECSFASMCNKVFMPKCLLLMHVSLHNVECAYN